MKELKKVMLLVAALMLVSASSAFAFPTINGNVIGDDWTTGRIVYGADPKDVILTGSIPSGTAVINYDIEHFSIVMDSSGGANDGLYMLWDLYGTPTFTTLDMGGENLVSYQCLLDMNQDGDYLDAVDRKIYYTQAGLVVKNGSGTVLTGTTSAAMGDYVEWYIAKDMFSTFPDGSFDGFILLDNGGGPNDDQLPDEGTFRTPEPGSIMLLGMGLVGFAGSLLRRKFMA